MEGEQNNEKIPADQATAQPPKVKGNKRQGKGSKAKNITKFRERTNAQQEEKRLNDIATKYGLFQTDDTKQLETIADRVQLTAQTKAVPLSVTTRSVGFATAIFYDRAASTWNTAAISAIATIHQVYRVNLWLTHYKVFLAQQIQVEPVSSDALMRIFITDEIREILNTVMEVPSLQTLILDSIGKIENSGRVYHMGYAYAPNNVADLLEYQTVCVNPLNIRQIVAALANPDTPLEVRAEYARYNSIPGAYVVGSLLLNADQIYPEQYGPAEMRADVHAYKNLLTRVQPRLPKHTVLQFSWSGKAALSGLWSGPRTLSRIESQFQQCGSAASRGSRRVRDARGISHMVDNLPVAENVYLGSNVIGERSNYWSMEATPHTASVVGIASLVGEECFVHSRYELVAHSSVANTAATILYAFSDAPR